MFRYWCIVSEFCKKHPTRWFLTILCSEDSQWSSVCLHRLHISNSQTLHEGDPVRAPHPGLQHVTHIKQWTLAPGVLVTGKSSHVRVLDWHTVACIATYHINLQPNCSVAALQEIEDRGWCHATIMVKILPPSWFMAPFLPLLQPLALTCKIYHFSPSSNMKVVETCSGWFRGWSLSCWYLDCSSTTSTTLL